MRIFTRPRESQSAFLQNPELSWQPKEGGSASHGGSALPHFRVAQQMRTVMRNRSPKGVGLALRVQRIPGVIAPAKQELGQWRAEVVCGKRFAIACETKMSGATEDAPLS
jgi:hypothetical protein